MHHHPVSAIPKKTQQHSPLYKNRNASLFQEMAVFNYTTKDIYMSAATGSVEVIKPRCVGRSGRSVLVVQLRAYHGTERKFDALGHEVADKTFDVYEIEITESQLDRSPGWFIPAVSLLFSTKEEFARTNHPHTRQSLEQRLRECVAAEIDALNTAPIMCVFNDPYGRMNKLFFSYGDCMFMGIVSNDTSRPCSCDIRILNEYGEYDVITLDTNEVATAKQTVEYQGKTIVISSNRNEISAHLLSTKVDNDKMVSKATMEKFCEQKTEEYKNIISRQKVEIDELKYQLNSLQAVHAALQTQVNAQIQSEENERQRENARRSELVKRDTENIKLEKERVAAASSDVAAMSTSVKAMAVILPAMFGIMAYAAKASAAVSAVSSSPTLGGVAVAVGIGVAVVAAGKYLVSAAKSIGGAIVDGISSLFSWW